MPSKSLAASCLHGMDCVCNGNCTQDRFLGAPKHIHSSCWILHRLDVDIMPWLYLEVILPLHWAMIVVIMVQNAENNSFICGYLFNNCCGKDSFETFSSTHIFVTFDHTTGNDEKAACVFFINFFQVYYLSLD